MLWSLDDGYVLAHRLTRKLSSWFQASAKPAPKGATVSEFIESAFAKLARLKSKEWGGEDADAETVEPPPVATGISPGAEDGSRSRRNRPLSKRCHPCFSDCLGVIALLCCGQRIIEQTQENIIFEGGSKIGFRSGLNFG